MKFLKDNKKYIPLYFIVAYILFTLFLFVFGTIQWNVENISVTILMIFTIYAAFSIGYILVANKKEVSNQKNIKIDFYKQGKTIFLVGLIIAIIFYISNMYFVYGENIIEFIKYPGASYDYQEFLQKMYNAGETIHFSTFFRLISRTKTLFSGVIVLAYIYGVFYYKRLSIPKKTLFYVALGLYLLNSWLIGIQNSYYILLFFFAGFAMFSIIKAIKHKEEFKKTLKRNIVVGLIILVMCGFASYYFQKDREVQRGIRTEIVKNNEIEEMNDEVWNYIVINSVNIRLGKIILDIPVPEGFENQLEIEEKEIGEIKENAGNNEFNVRQLSDYYTTKEDSFLKRVNSKLYFSVQSIEMYLTQGYAALALGTQHEFEWTYFLGNSLYLTELVENNTSLDIFEKTYVYKNEVEYGWPTYVYFSSLYLLLASDFTFYLLPVLFLGLGMLFAGIWKSLLKDGNYISMAVFIIFIWGIMLASCNNALFQNMIGIIQNGTIILFYVAFVTLNKRRKKNEVKK